jgi:glycosyltransferase domain-containing protein
MPSLSPSRLTVIIPTYNRPAYLRSLLGYLSARRFAYPIRVLDSSGEEALTQNRETIANAPLNIVHDIFAPTTPVYTKQHLGVRSVDTSYCTLCADDDILTTDLDPFLDALDTDSSIAAVQGFYVNFRPGDIFDISDVVDWTPSITGDDGLKRICQQMAKYQAFSYAIHRTDAMKRMLSQLDRANALLAQELLSSSLILVEGSVHRLPRFFMARNTNQSIATTGWHPYHFLATDPSSLFREYADYRSVVLEHLLANARCSERYTPAQMQSALDLVHLKYLAPFIRGPVMDYLIDRSFLAEAEPGETIAHIWSNYLGGRREPEGLKTVATHFLRALKERGRARRVLGYLRRMANVLGALAFRENLNVLPERRLGNLQIRRQTRAGKMRHYRLSREFLNQPNLDGRRISAAEIRSMIEQLDDYV